MRKLHVVTLRSVRRYFVGASVIALMAGGATAASAACTTGNPVDCTGATVGKVTTGSTGTVDVASGATLTAATGDNAALGVTSGAGYGTVATIQVDGTITGTAANGSGIIGNATTPNYAYPSTRLDIKVGATGQISGYDGVYLDADTGGSGYRTVGATLDNSGLVTGVYKALVSGNTSTSGFLSITNEAGGIIRGGSGAIYTTVGNLTNAGLIDGGSGSAYSFSVGYSGVAIYPSSVTNTGTMTASGIFATIDIEGYVGQITNSGTIVGANNSAVYAYSYINLSNAAGGVIRTNQVGGDAINAAGGGTIVNQGEIDGTVSMSRFSSNDSILTNVGGTINGNVVFGGGNDVLNVAWDASANRIAGISGTIDGGGGTNTLRLELSQNASVDNILGHLAMPANFQKLGFVLDSGVTATLNGNAPNGLLIGGNGNFVNTGSVTSTGAAFTQTLGPPYDYTSAIGFANSGNIASVFSPPGGVIQYNDYAVQLSAVRSFNNSGTITSTGGNGVSVVLGSQDGSTTGTFANSGSIIADGTALNLASGSGTNSGNLRSNQGIGLSLGGSLVNSGSIAGVTSGATVNGGTLSNTGTITGSATGVQLSGGTLSNAGTITATNGVGVSSYYGTLNNLAGGVITGSSDAIENTYGGITVTNAGTINGNVNFALAPSYYYTQGNVFVDQGGTINGSLLFGSGADTYVTDASKFVNGKFTNVSGTVDGGGGQDSLILRVGADTTTKFAAAANFERTQYDLSNGAKLSLGADAPITGTLVLAGTGSVNLTADFNVTDVQALVVGTAYGSNYNDPSALSIVSHGNLVFTRTSGYSNIGMTLASTTTFENAGNITVSSSVITTPSPAAINGGALVTNSGTITVTDAAAVLNALKVVNTGTIMQGPNAQTAFGQYTYGLYGVNNVENSGKIVTGGAAVTLGYVNYSATSVPAPSVTNSGVIHSTGGDAIDQYYSYPQPSGATTITNTASGQIISDKGDAINSGGYSTNIYNDGIITGNIQLYSGTNLVENHGTITGNINLGYGNGTLLLTGGSFTGAATAQGNGRLELDVTDANAPILALGSSTFTGFSELDMQAGAATLGGTYSFDTVNVSGGALFGLAGSSLSAPGIAVAKGASFGSAGTVTGNIAVNGTLYAGGVGGTMTVKGAVALAKGATALFDLTPTAAYKLQVAGLVTIADGATLQLTGNPAALTPGQKLNLIQASGGITGKFSTVSGGPAALYLIQSANTLQGLELFTANTAFPTQVSNTVGILNTALINGQASSSLIAAMPALVNATTGESDPNALLRLTPQAYASAAQLATEDALSVVDALRDETHFVDGAPAGFAFGHAVAGGRKAAGDSASGVSEGRLTDSGVLSGVGYGARSAWIAAFGGYLDGLERLPELGARTTTHSLVLGAQGQVQAGGFRLGLMGAYDRGEANTKRSAPGDIDANGRYALKSWIGNIDVAYRAPLNADWAVEPRLAASYVRTVRDGTTEQGGGAFALTVDEGRSANWFVDGHVEFDGGQGVGQAVHPFVSVGFVTRTSGQANIASATLAGLPVPLTVDGLDLPGTRAAVGGGVRYDLSHALKASVGYDGEFGKNGRQAVDIGLHWSF